MTIVQALANTLLQHQARGIVVYKKAMFIVILLMALTSHVFATQNANTIVWQPYSSSIFDQAKKTHRLILLFGKSESCHWCREMEQTTWRAPQVIQAINAKYIPVKVDVDSETTVAIRYRMTSLPSTLILDGDNQVVKYLKGAFSPTDLLQYLNGISSRNTTAQMSATAVTAIDKNSVKQSLSSTVEVSLQQEQTKRYEEEVKETQDAVTLAAVEYGLTQPAGVRWVKQLLQWKLKSLTNDEAFTPESAALDLQLFVIGYVYFHDPAYLAAAAKPLDHLVAQLQSFPAQNKWNTAQYGLMLQGLSQYLKVKPEETLLKTVTDVTKILQKQFSIPEGGYRHTLTENDVVYLADTLQMGKANLALYQVTMNPAYLNQAEDAAHFIQKYFENTTGTGYMSSLDLMNSATQPVLNANDNADLITFVSLLESYSGNPAYQAMQTKALHYLTNVNVYSHAYPAVILLAANDIDHGPGRITIVGAKSDLMAKRLFLTALAYMPDFTRIDWWDKSEGPLMNSTVSFPDFNKSAAYVCHERQCSFPIFHEKDLIEVMSDHTGLANQDQQRYQPLQATAGFLQWVKNQIYDTVNTENILSGKKYTLVVLGFLLLGLLLSFTPCILPLVPIIASIIVGHTIGVKRQKTFFLTLCYVLGMSLAYAILGMLAGMFGIYLQRYMQQPWIIAFFSVIFFLLALSMLGAYELRIPLAIQNKVSAMSNMQKGGTYLGVMIMGALSVLIISPCVSAPLAGVLSFITRTGNYTLGALSLFCMGLGMGIPLLGITLFSANILPKAARWNRKIKAFLGIILLGAAIWMVNRIIPEIEGMMLWSGYIIFVTLYMGITKNKTRSLWQKFWKTVSILLFVFGITLFWNALFLTSDMYQLLKSRPLESVADSVEFQTAKNNDDLIGYINNAMQLHKPVLVFFTAKWCSACARLEHSTFHENALLSLLRHFTLVQVDMTEMTGESLALAHQYQILGPPMMVFFDNDGKLVSDRVVGEMDGQALGEILQKVLTRTS